MPNLQFVLELDRTGTPPTAVRLWLDVSRDDELDRVEEELVIGTVDGKIWMARKTIEGSTEGMLFFVKFIAPIGAKWRFTVDGEAGRLYDGKPHEMESTRESLAGRLK